VVAALSTVAPLALAGAVHLYILIARGPGTRSTSDLPDRAHAGQPTASPVTAPGVAGQQQTKVGQGTAWSVTAPSDRPPAGNPPPAASRTALGNTGPDPDSPTADPQPVASAPVRPDRRGRRQNTNQDTDNRLPATARTTGDRRGRPRAGDRSGGAGSGTRQRSRPTDSQPGGPDTEELLAIARRAAKAEDRLTRTVVAQAIRGQKIPLSNHTLTQLMRHLREQDDEAVSAPSDRRPTPTNGDRAGHPTPSPVSNPGPPLPH